MLSIKDLMFLDLVGFVADMSDLTMNSSGDQFIDVSQFVLSLIVSYRTFSRLYELERGEYSNIRNYVLHRLKIGVFAFLIFQILLSFAGGFSPKDIISISLAIFNAIIVFIAINSMAKQ